MKSLFEKAQQFGKSFMLPIAILPAAGLLFSKIYQSSLQLVSQSDYLEAIKVLQV